MFKSMKLESFRRLFKILIYLSLFGILILAMFLDDMIQVVQGPKNVTKLSRKSIQNRYCEMDIYGISKGIFNASIGIYYVVDCGIENDILLCVPYTYNKKRELIEIYNQAGLHLSEDQRNHESRATLTGIVKASNKNEIAYLLKWIKKNEASYINVNENKHLYTFYIADSPFIKTETLFRLIGISLICILIVLFIMISLICGRFNQRIVFYIAPLEKKDMKKKLLEDANAVYLSGVKFDGGLVLTKEYLFFYQYAYSMVMLLEEINFIDALPSKKQKESAKQYAFDLYITLKSGKTIIVKKSKAMELFHYIRDNRKDLVKRKLLSNRLYGD